MALTMNILVSSLFYISGLCVIFLANLFPQKVISYTELSCQNAQLPSPVRLKYRSQAARNHTVTKYLL